MESLVGEWAGKRVLVTGHTGFKGAWLCEWLLLNDAKVAGLALPPDTPGSLFELLDLERRVEHTFCDVRDPAALADAVRVADPEFIFHLAAQALVGRGYDEPLTTWQTNVNGTLNLLEAARGLGRRVVVVAVTTDKVYRNREWEYAYREEDELGGRDPYSASKAACEIAVASWRMSFGTDDGVTVVTARAGNVLGGGDWAADRVVPDCFRAWRDGTAVRIRNPYSTRPWQHVIEPLSGYLALAAHAHAHAVPAVWTCNFGPGVEGNRNVRSLVDALVQLGPDRAWHVTSEDGRHESRALALSIDRARYHLRWQPRLTFDETVEWTNEGYGATSADLPRVVRRQLIAYQDRCLGATHERD